MIRVSLPIPTAVRATMRVEIGARRLGRSVRSAGNRAVTSLRETPSKMWYFLRGRPIPPNSEAFAELEMRYQDLVDVVCSSAKEGITDRRAESYAHHREWFRSNYARFKPWLLPHGMDDPFPALYAPESLEDVVHAEHAIVHIQSGWDALERCRAEMKD